MESVPVECNRARPQTGMLARANQMPLLSNPLPNDQEHDLLSSLSNAETETEKRLLVNKDRSVLN